MQITRGGVDLVEQRNDRFFVRDGAVDAAQLALCQSKRFLQILRRYGDADVIRVLAGGCKQLCVQRSGLIVWPSGQPMSA